MPQKSNKLSQFWQELKRRRVIHVVTVYASATFVIIELINNLEDTLNFPPKLLTIVVIVLAVGFPLAIILSWFYDLTSEGVEKTKPIEEVKDGEKTLVPNAWKIATYVSFVVIVGLAVLNIVGGGKQLRAGDIQSIIILPFDNYTGDEELDNLLYGMHAMLVGDVGRISGVRVIGTKTSNVYRDVDMSATEIASERNVDAVMETSVMCMGDSVCIQHRLVKTTGEEEQIWIADYNEDKVQILNLNNKIIRQLADEIMIELTPEEERLLSKSRTVDREAYDDYLWGSFLLDDGSEESLYKALEYLNSAIEKDPDWAPLYSGLISVWLTLAQGGAVSPEIADPKIIAYRNKALELDPDFADIHHVNAMVAFLKEWNWEKAEKEFLKAIAINPNKARSRVLYGHLLCCLQRPGEALTQGQLAIELDPLNPLVQFWYSAILLGLGDYEAALTIGENLVATKQDHAFGNSIIELAASYCRDYNKVMEAAKYVLAAKEVDFKEVERIFGESGFVAAYEEILRQSEVLAQKGYTSPVGIATRYMMVDQPDKAMEWIEKGFEVRDPLMPYIATHSRLCEPLFDNPRFIAILEKMNLPLPEE